MLMGKLTIFSLLYLHLLSCEFVCTFLKNFFKFSNFLRYRRVVSYTADDHHGFVANVRREPLGHQEHHKIIAQPAVTKYVAPVTKVIAQPAIHVQKYSAPVQTHYQAPAQQYYQAPAVQTHYQAPAQQYYQAPVQKYVAPVQHHQYQAPVQHTQYVAPVQHHQYVAPVQKVAVPVVQKYIQPAPVVEKYVQPIVQKYVAPVVQKTVVAQPIKYTSAEHSAHVSVNGPHFNYHY